MVAVYARLEPLVNQEFHDIVDIQSAVLSFLGGALSLLKNVTVHKCLFTGTKYRRF